MVGAVLNAGALTSFALCWCRLPLGGLTQRAAAIYLPALA